MTNKPETLMYYRSIGQTKDGLTITAETKQACTEARARGDAEEYVFPAHTYTNRLQFVTVPIATSEGWERGYVNFCPRCGKHLGDNEGTDSSTYYGDCFECGAELDITITMHTEDEGADD